MLINPTIHKLQELKLHGMVKAFHEQENSHQAKKLDFDDRLSLLVDREMTERDNKRLTSRLRGAKLRTQASIEDINYRSPRGLDKSVVRSLATCDWIRKRQNILISGATGTGKTYIACAFGHQACREGFKVLYFRSPRLFQELGIARGDGRYTRLMEKIAKVNLLIIDDWGISSLTDHNRTDLLEILEDRHDIHSTIIASQLPIKHWHEAIGNPTIADSIMDRLIHHACNIDLKGESMRKRRLKN